MNPQCSPAIKSSDGRLQGVIEPLANFICAADQPRAALLSALRTLVSEVRMTQRTASAYVGASHRLAPPAAPVGLRRRKSDAPRLGASPRTIHEQLRDRRAHG